MGENTGGQSRLVVNCRNNPVVPDGVDKNKVTRQGIGLVDFTGDGSLTREGGTSAATQSFRTLMDLSTRGGYGAIHTEDFQTVVVGRMSPPCALFPKLGSGDDARGYKGFALDEFAEVKNADRFPDLFEALENRAHLATLHSPNEGDENPGAEAVMDAFQELEMAGETCRFQG